MKVAVLGSGLMGSAAAKYLVARAEIERVQLIDVDETKLEKTAKTVNNRKLVPLKIDTTDKPRLTKSIRGNDSVLVALPHPLAPSADLAAIDAGVSAVDIAYEDEQMKLDAHCKRKGVTLIPGCGMGPGIPQILVGEATRQLTSIDQIRLLVGGVPLNPKPPLNYRVTWSIDMLFALWARKRARIIRNGRVRTTAAMSDVETVNFQKPFENMEASLCDVPLATLMYTMKGRVASMDSKLVQYPGHARQIRTLIETGMLSMEPATIGKMKLKPREFLSAVLGPKMMLGKEKDVVLIKVIVSGKQGECTAQFLYELVDFYDEREHITAMARTTAYTGAIAAIMLAKRQVTLKGVVPPEIAFAGPLFQDFMKQLAEENIRISRVETRRTQDITR